MDELESAVDVGKEDVRKKSECAVADLQKTETFWSNEHFIELNEKLQVLFDNQQFCDITLISSDDEYKVKAHKIVLASVSKYFLAMFGGSLCESEAGAVRLSQIDGRSLKAILNFIYKGIIELTIDSVESVLVGANVLQLSALEKICCAYIKRNIDVSNCLGISYFAKLRNCDELYNAAMLCACENFVALREEDEFLSLSLDQLCELITRDDLRMPSEGDVFHSIMAWMHFRRDERKQFLEKLLSYVRFPLLSPGFIARFIEKEEEASRIICKAFVWHLNPEKRPAVFSRKQCQIRNLKDVIVAISGFGNPNSNLRVALFYSGLGEWVYAKWPALPYPRMDVKFTIMGKMLIVAGGMQDGTDSNLVDCFDLETFEWMPFPPLPFSRLNCMTTLNGTVYAFSDNCFNKLTEPFEQWTAIHVPGASPMQNIKACAAYKDLIYFPFDGFFCSYNPVEDSFNMQKIWRESNDSVVGMHIIRHLDTDYLIEITEIRNSHSTCVVYGYDLNTSACLIKNSITMDPDDMRTELHGKNIIIHEGTQFLEYDVFENQLHTLPNLSNDFKEIDIVLGSNETN